MEMEAVMEMDVSVSGRFTFRDVSRFVGWRWGRRMGMEVEMEMDVC